MFSIDELKIRKQKAESAVDSAKQAVDIIKLEIAQYDMTVIREKVYAISKLKEAFSREEIDAIE